MTTAAVPSRDERRELPDGRPAPRLLVQFQCPGCLVSEVRDAYLGVPICQTENSAKCHVRRPVMLPERIVPEDDVVEVPGR